MADLLPFPERPAAQTQKAPAWLAMAISAIAAVRDVLKLALQLAVLAGVPMLAGAGLLLLLRG